MVSIVEQYLCSKKGNLIGGEDRLILGPNFYGVADGATDKSGLNWGTEEKARRGGNVLADIVKEVLEKTTTIHPEKLVIELNTRINYAADQAEIDLTNVNNRADVGFVAYVPQQNAIYSIHDCIFGLVDQNDQFTVTDNDKEVDKKMAGIRAGVIKVFQQYCVNPFANGNDLGRDAILPFLKEQPRIQNRGFQSTEEWMFGVSQGDVAYKTLNGLPTTIDVFSVPEGTKEIILATDGYKLLKPTLNKTERTLKAQLIADPYCLNELKGTKGIAPGNVSFDDRAYLRIKL